MNAGNSTNLNVNESSFEEFGEDFEFALTLPERIKNYVFYDAIYPLDAKVIFENFFLSGLSEEEYLLELRETERGFMKEEIELEG